jgi:enediyne biosynthesis protein E4
MRFLNSYSLFRCCRHSLLAFLMVVLFQHTFGQRTRFELLNAEESGFDFINALPDTARPIKFLHMYSVTGGGVSLGDLNNDGLDDIVIIGCLGDVGVYANQGKMQFKRIQHPSLKYSQFMCTVALADVNNDGLLDIYICRNSFNYTRVPVSNLLLINMGQFRFREAAAEFGVNYSGNSTCATFFDKDNDGDLDLYVGNIPSRNLLRLSFNSAGSYNNLGSDRLYENRNNKFVDVTAESGIPEENGFALATIAADINQDGHMDVFVSNDFFYEDYVYINDGKGKFTNQSKTMISHMPFFGMGADVADFNNDGLVDMCNADMMQDELTVFKNEIINTAYDFYEMYGADGQRNRQRVRNCLHLNRGNGTFSEIGEMAGVDATFWSWAMLLADFNNDGWKDLLVTKGNPAANELDFLNYGLDSINTIIKNSDEYKNMPPEDKAEYKSSQTKLLSLYDFPNNKYSNYIFENNKDLTFKRRMTDWGIDQKVHSTGAAYGDLDNDGDLDIVMNNFNEPAFLYKNTTRERDNTHYIRLKFKTQYPGNPNGIGTKAYVYQKGNVQYAELIGTRGFMSTCERVLHFGLGQDENIDSIVVVWLYNNKKQVLFKPKANQTLQVVLEEANSTYTAPKKPVPQFFENIRHSTELILKHKEDYYIDFKLEPLMVFMISRYGPGIACGDVNADGLEDLYIGGAATQAGAVLLQNENKQFKASEQPEIWKTAQCEDLGSLFFDVDNDGDMDLYVASGGTSSDPHTPPYQHRLFLNDGKGNFKATPLVGDSLRISSVGIAAADFDRDGDLDLFVSCRVTPGLYPLAGPSRILENQKGAFVDVTATVAPALLKIGMVSQGLWTDVDNDGWLDLMIAGHWMPITYLKNTNGRLISQTAEAGLSKTNGWWNSITGADIDNDGDIDYICGNNGTNTRFVASPEEPMAIHAVDYDGNGTIDPIMSMYDHGLHQPIHRFNKVADQIPKIKREYLRVAKYAFCSLEDFLPVEMRQKAYKVETYEMRSGVFLNDNGRFRFQAFPNEAQISPIMGIQALDLNADPYVDLVIVGNLYDFDVENNFCDALKGLVMLGNEGQQWKPLTIAESGIDIPGDARALSAVLLGKNKQELMLLATQNDGFLDAYRFKNKMQATFMLPGKGDTYAEIAIGAKKRKQEFYIGSGFCSQSTPFVIKHAGVGQVQLGKHPLVKR